MRLQFRNLQKKSLKIDWDFKQKVVYEDLPKDDPKKRQPDIAKAKKLLGWEPKVNRQEGFEDYL